MLTEKTHESRECWGFFFLRNGDVHDHCLKETKHTNTIFNVVRQIVYIHRRDRYYQRQRKNTTHGEGSHPLNSHLSLLHRTAAAYGSRVAGGSPSFSLFFSLLQLYYSTLFLSLILCCTLDVYLQASMTAPFVHLSTMMAILC